MAIDPITAALDIGGRLIDRLWPDPEQRDKAKLELMQMQQTGELAQLTAETELAKGQLEINKIEAGNSSLFVSGWRPSIGWTCSSAFAYNFVIQPFLVFVAKVCGLTITPDPLPIEALITVLVSMLGLGTMRTYEKRANLKYGK